MKTFIFKVLLFATLLAAIVSILSVKMCQSEEGSYVAGIKLKHHRLDSLSGKRVILTGGSNVAFGIDSKTIQNSIQLPVVNLSLHAGLGLDFVLGELHSAIREGDIVFLSPEYYASYGRYNLLKEVVFAYPPAAAYFSDDKYKDFEYFFESKFEQIKTNKYWLSLLIKEKLMGRKPEVSVYDSTSFNSYGDVVAHLDRTGPSGLNDKKKYEYTYWNGIEKLNAFASYAASKKVKVFFLFPAYARSAYELNKDVLKQYERDILTDLNIPVINTPEDFVYADTAFFDTVYHLKKKAREERTRKFLEIIKGRPEVEKAIGQ